MKVYKYWARGEATVDTGDRERRDLPRKVSTYSGSNEGMDDAARQAQQRATRAAEALSRGEPRGSYGYADRALREETVQELNGGDGPIGIITRNSYGSLVLNSARAMFVDVDRPDKSVVELPLGQLLRNVWDSLRGKSAEVAASRDKQFTDKFAAVIGSHPGLGARIYRTANGFRLLITSDTFDALAPDTHRLLKEFGADPLYARLCQTQECFRARLSAKFWRCGAPRPPSRFPWEGPAEEAAYRQWEQEYHVLANQYATCEHLVSLGEPHVHEEVRPILESHDQLTIHDGAPLA